jgi:predicted RNA-binding protein with PIN domain
LGGVRKVLDEDEAFRLRVRDAAAASETDVGRPSWLLLDRPAGWVEELAALASSAASSRAAVAESRAETSAVRRLSAAEDARGRAEAALSDVRAEVAELRARLADERRGRALAETELGRVRARLAGADGQLAAVEERLRSALAAPAPAPVSEPVAAVPDVEAPVPVVDASALAAAVESASAALAEATALLAPFVGEETGVPRARRRPARMAQAAGRQPVRLPPAVFDDTAEAAEFLVRVPGVVVLVDGYNVTKLGWPELSLPEQRRWLLDSASGLAARTGAEALLVFDGDDDGGVRAPADRSRRSGVQVRFSPAGVEADDVVLELAATLPAEQPVVVASNDRRVRDGARRVGANVVSSDQLLAVLGVARR